jgi:hypothetical protein
VVASLFLRLSIVSVDAYPIVIARTKSAPGMTAGLPTGMSKYRHPTPTAKLIARPTMNFMDYSNLTLASYTA